MPPFSPGQLIGKYRIAGVLGRGGTGVVYLAEDQTLGRQVALKVIDRAVTAGKDFEGRFRQEARLVAALSHPNIIAIHSLERIDGEVAIDMPFIRRGSLANAEQSGAFRLQQVLAVVRDVLDALACCHQAGIVHRDVKPSNILLSDDGRALLSDFGLAKILAAHQRDTMRSTHSGIFLGTPRYAPPEAWDDGAATPAWDIYSVGAMLYEAVAGTAPYEAATPLSLVRQFVERPAPPLASVVADASPQLAELVDAMLARNPEERPQHAHEVVAALSDVPELESDSAGGGSSVTLIDPIPRSTRTSRRLAPSKRLRRLAVWGAIALAGVLLLVSGLLWTERAPEVDLGAAASPGGPPTGLRVFDAFEPASEETWPNHWLMQPGAEPNTFSVLAFEGTHLWFLNASSSDDVLTLDGHWAEYTDESARVFRHGIVWGSGRWLSNGRDMMVDLEFWCELDGMQWKRPLVLKEAAEPITGADFIGRWESAAYMQPLVYNELAPRGLPWVEAMEESFFVPIRQHGEAPFLHAGAGAIEIDGALDEPAWRVALSEEEGAGDGLTGRGGDPRSKLLLRYSEDGLYLGVRLQQAVDSPTLHVALITEYVIPMADAPRRSVLAGLDGIRAYRCTVGGRPVDWECSWQTACAISNDVFEAELFVPFESIEGGAPHPGARWRINCAVREGDAPDTEPVSWWGASQTESVEHGALLSFEPKE